MTRKLMNQCIYFVCLCSTAIAQAGATSIVPMVYFDFWNTANVQLQNNCYNYATNRETDNFAQPGEASSAKYKSINCEDVAQAASQDFGLEQTKAFPFSGKRDDMLLALVVAPDEDYHWYRRGDDNMWTHKPGSTMATNVDNAGAVITSPETADRGSYSLFCGYFKVKNFVRDPNEQNGGYVRIGNMNSLPTAILFNRLGISNVEVSMYSGRPDPSIALNQILTILDQPELSELAQLAQDMKTGKFATHSLPTLPLELKKLGYRGIQINDPQGLFFPAGTKARIRQDYIFVSHPNLHGEIRWTRIMGLSALEKKILSVMKVQVKI